MIVAFLVAMLCGVLAVIQSGLYKILFEKMGVFYSLLINHIVTVALCLILFIVFHFIPLEKKAYFAIREDFQFQWMYLIPGVFAIFILIGSSYSLAYLGATKAFLVLISFSVLTGLLWDYFYEGIGISPLKVLGILLVLLGLTLTISS